MQFQLSIFHQGSYFSYSIDSEDERIFHFHLKSAPIGKSAPKEFTAIREAKDAWSFDQELDEEFTDDVKTVLKRAKL